MNDRQLELYKDLTSRISLMSRATRLKVGCLIVKNDNIISFSWNGTPRGLPNECEEFVNGVLKTKSNVIHAEENALLKLTKSNQSSEGAILFCTHAPCIHCARMIYNAGISKVYYMNLYKTTEGLDFLESVGVETEFSESSTLTREELSAINKLEYEKGYNNGFESARKCYQPNY